MTRHLTTRPDPIPRIESTRSEAVRCDRCRCLIDRPKVARRFGLLDAMILVAATACALALARETAGPQLRTITSRLFVAAPMVLTAWSLALLAIRLRRPRPALRRLLRQPGTAASMAALSMVAVATVLAAIAAVVYFVRLQQRATLARHSHLPFAPTNPLGLEQWLGFATGCFSELFRLVGPAVIGVWVVLALSGRRRVERSLIDGLGRFVGTCWIISAIAWSLFVFISRNR